MPLTWWRNPDSNRICPSLVPKMVWITVSLVRQRQHMKRLKAVGMEILAKGWYVNMYRYPKCLYYWVLSFRNYSSKFPSLEKTLRKPKVEDNSRRTIIGIVSGSVQSMAMRELQAGVAAIFHFPVHIIPPLRFFSFDSIAYWRRRLWLQSRACPIPKSGKLWTNRSGRSV